jgi:hypothetical protein
MSEGQQVRPSKFEIGDIVCFSPGRKAYAVTSLAKPEIPGFGFIPWKGFTSQSPNNC